MSTIDYRRRLSSISWTCKTKFAPPLSYAMAAPALSKTSGSGVRSRVMTDGALIEKRRSKLLACARRLDARQCNGAPAPNWPAAATRRWGCRWLFTPSIPICQPAMPMYDFFVAEKAGEEPVLVVWWRL